MNKNFWLVLVLIVLAALVFVTSASAFPANDLKELRRATAAYKSTAAAEAAGYVLIPGLDHCFENPGTGAMGYHYINPELLDLDLDPLRPEAMVYAPSKNGKLKLAAVEFIVPAAEWDAAGHKESPMTLGQHLHLNPDLGVYVLHAWVWLGNPDGVFADWNPKVSCP